MENKNKGIDWSKDNVYDGIGRPDLKPKEMTTCKYDGTIETFNCEREEQCDDCFMKDHLRDCLGCEHYEHPLMSVDEMITHLGKRTGINSSLFQVNEPIDQLINEARGK